MIPLKQQYFVYNTNKDILISKSKKIMTHGHEVLNMMEGNCYASTQELIDAIIAQFGREERFFTCSADNMTAQELVCFLQERGKFKPSSNKTFTVDKNKICNHE